MPKKPVRAAKKVASKKKMSSPTKAKAKKVAFKKQLAPTPKKKPAHATTKATGKKTAAKKPALAPAPAPGKAKAKAKRSLEGGAELLGFAAANARTDGALSAAFEGRYDRVLFFEKNARFDGDLLTALKKVTKEDFDIIAVAGDLHVSGRIALYEGTPGLWVGGTTTAETLEGGDCEIAIGEGKFTYFVYGEYNDGILDTGDVETLWVINSDHDLRVPKTKGTKWIDNFGDDDEYDFTSANIAVSFVPEVRSDDDDDAIDVPKFLARLRQGKPVLVGGAKTAGEQALETVKQAKDDRVYELDMSKKKLKAFPSDVLKMPWLKKLVLDGNAIRKVPKEIAKLTELEHLSLEDCDLKELPEEIGRLTKLRVLRIGRNTIYGSKSATAIALPDSFGDLASLEELDLSGLSRKPDGPGLPALPELSTFTLPASASKLTKLKTIVANETNLVLPKEMEGLASVETVSMAGISWAYLRRFPVFVTTFPNLRKLDVSGNFFPELPASLAKLTKLEVLDLHNALGFFAAPLPDLSTLTRLRVLKLSGNTGHTGVPVPSHDKLRPLFAMTLPRLEELSIDRWGAEKKGDRGPLTADLLAGIGRFKGLKILDLEFDGLQSLPDDFFDLHGLVDLKLGYNALDEKWQARITNAFPDARISFDRQKL